MAGLPNFIVGGAPKSGTTSVCAWLADHPQATCSSRKETFYLLDRKEWIIDPKFNYHTAGLDGYRDCFPRPKPGSRVLFEGTTLYLYQETARDVLSRFSERPKMLFVLREPSRRVFSNYQYFHNNKPGRSADVTFTDYLAMVRRGHDFDGNNQLADAIEHSRYAQFLAPWIQDYGKDHVRVWIFERVVKNPAKHMTELCEWLGIAPDFYGAYEFKRENPTYVPKNRRFHALSNVIAKRFPQSRVREVVRDFYRKLNTTPPPRPTNADDGALAELKAELSSSVAEVEKLLGYPIPEWK